MVREQLERFAALTVLDLRYQHGGFDCTSLKLVPSGIQVLSDCGEETTTIIRSTLGEISSSSPMIDSETSKLPTIVHNIS